MKHLIIYTDDHQTGVIPFTEVKIVKDSYLYGGEEKEVYSVYIYFENTMIFTTNNKQEIIQQSDKLFIYNY